MGVIILVIFELVGKYSSLMLTKWRLNHLDPTPLASSALVAFLSRFMVAMILPSRMI
jgi:hypothetical protein